MKLIIGLGNPEKQYDGTRHNIGFRVLDEFAEKHSLSWKQNKKLRAEMAEYNFDDTKVLLAKPTTYYNLVGESVRAIADFYKIDPSEILVVHDELALPFGTIRTREQGGDAGNNGMKSIIQHLGPTTKRIRIGIANELCDHMDAADFVLAKFQAAENRLLGDSIKPIALEHIDKFVNDSFEPTKITHSLLAA